MYKLRTLLNKNVRMFGECDWERKTVWLNPARIWRVMVTEHPNRTRLERDFGPVKLREFREQLFIIALRETLFHEFLHEFLYENKIRPWLCNGCHRSRCKLCKLTNALIGYF